MKKVFAFAVAAIIVTNAFAIDIDPKIKVRSNAQLKKASLTFIAEGNEKVFVEILNEDREVVFQELIVEAEAFSRPYDLSKLEGTEFTFQVRANGKLLSETISLKNEKKSAFVAFAEKSENDKVLLKVLQADVNPVSIQIMNNRGEVVFEKTERNYSSFIQSFDFSKMGAKASIRVFNGEKEEIITL